MVAGVLLTGVLTAAPLLEVVTLENGMRWVLAPRGTTARVGGTVVVNAGSVHERLGEAGVAHFLEHLAFKGTPVTGPRVEWRLERELLRDVLKLVERQVDAEQNHGLGSAQAMKLETELVAAERDWEAQGDPDAFTDLLHRLDANWNASTSSDQTVYWADFPSSQLAAWCTAEAQRFAAPVFREFRTERKVVLQERLDRETPATDATAALFRLAFGASRPLNLLGTAEGLRQIRPSTVDAFYARLYAPSNAVGALVGRFDVELAKRWLTETFARIPDRRVDAAVALEAGPGGTTRMQGTESRILIGLALPARQDQRWPQVRVAHGQLSRALGRRCLSSKRPCGRLERTIGPGEWRPSVDVFVLTPSDGASVDEVVDWFFEIAGTIEASDDDLASGRATLRTALAEACVSRRGAAEALAASLLHAGTTSFACADLGDVALEDVRRELRSISRDRAWLVLQEKR